VVVLQDTALHTAVCSNLLAPLKRNFVQFKWKSFIFDDMLQ
jgi:hypothetical protein